MRDRGNSRRTRCRAELFLIEEGSNNIEVRVDDVGILLLYRVGISNRDFLNCLILNLNVYYEDIHGKNVYSQFKPLVFRC